MGGEDQGFARREMIQKAGACHAGFERYGVEGDGGEAVTLDDAHNGFKHFEALAGSRHVGFLSVVWDRLTIASRDRSAATGCR